MEMKKAFYNILNFALADAVSWFTSLWGSFIAIAAFVGGVILAIVQKYLIRDLAFIPWLLIVITLDTITGYRLAKKRWREDPAKYPMPTNQMLRERVGGKLVAVSITLILLNGITNFEINGLPAQQQFIDLELFGWQFDLNVFKVIYFTGAAYMFFAEAKSVIRNIRSLGYNLISTKLDDTLEKFTGKKDETK